MSSDANHEAREVVHLQNQIHERLASLGFQDDRAAGAIGHHLAEVAVLGEKLSSGSLPTFLALSTNQRDELAETIVDIHGDLEEMKEAICDMESELISLMNFLNP